MPYDDFDTEDTGARWEPLSDDAWRFQNDAAGVSEVARSEVRPATGSVAARRAASAPASAQPEPRSAANPAAAGPFPWDGQHTICMVFRTFRDLHGKNM